MSRTKKKREVLISAQIKQDNNSKRGIEAGRIGATCVFNKTYVLQLPLDK